MATSWPWRRCSGTPAAGGWTRWWKLLGDSLSGPLLPLETAQFLMAQGWMTIAGNHERQLLTLGPDQWGLSDAYTHSRLTARELDWLAAQPPTGRFLPEVFVCHGTPQSDLDSLLETLEPTGCRTASALEVEGRLGDAEAEVVLVRPHPRAPGGARPVRPADRQPRRRSACRAWGSGDPPARIETGSPDARYATLERRGGRSLPPPSTRGPRPDHHAMADLAAARGRPDWESALRTGYMP